MIFYCLAIGGNDTGSPIYLYQVTYASDGFRFRFCDDSTRALRFRDWDAAERFRVLVDAPGEIVEGNE